MLMLNGYVPLEDEEGKKNLNTSYVNVKLLLIS